MEYKLESNPAVYLERDDLKFDTYIPQDILTKPKLQGTSFHLQHFFQDSIRHVAFRVNNITVYDQIYTVITSPIPEICEEPLGQGVFFMISENIIPPKDLANVTIIFNRLFANWLSRCLACMNERLWKHNQQLTGALASRPKIPNGHTIESTKQK